MNKIIAVIVTYNRLTCLKKCLEALKLQTLQNFDTLVINNGSTDGTKEYLDSLQGIMKIHQENVGGAGGFYSGMEYMFRHNYEWIWMMDDDGIPDSRQLEILVETAQKGNYDVLNALVIDSENHNNLSFVTNPSYSKISDLPSGEVNMEFFHPFNGTFISRNLIKNIGFVKKEMFIWGDEGEYMKRMEKYGYILRTCLNAKHYHPKEKGKKINVFPYWSKYQILDKPAKLSKYYYRNKGYCITRYHHWYNGVKYLLFTSLVLIRKFRFKEFFKLLYYYYKGYRNDFAD